MSQSPDHAAEEPDPQGISLDALSQAYADALGGDEAAGPRQGGSPEAADPQPDTEPPADPVDPAEPDDDPCPVSPATILEAMLFVGDRRNEPLEPARAAAPMRGVEPGEVPQLVDQLNRRYKAAGCPYRITSEGGGYRLVLRGAFDSLRNRFYGRVREAHLSQAAVDVLAILAYRQPLSGEQVSELRGTPSGHLLAQLVRRRLLRIERPEGKRRGARYFTTDRFLELFGLESLEELPQAEDVEPR